MFTMTLGRLPMCSLSQPILSLITSLSCCGSWKAAAHEATCVHKPVSLICTGLTEGRYSCWYK